MMTNPAQVLGDSISQPNAHAESEAVQSTRNQSRTATIDSTSGGAWTGHRQVDVDNWPLAIESNWLEMLAMPDDLRLLPLSDATLLAIEGEQTPWTATRDAAPGRPSVIRHGMTADIRETMAAAVRAATDPDRGWGGPRVGDQIVGDSPDHLAVLTV